MFSNDNLIKLSNYVIIFPISLFKFFVIHWKLFWKFTIRNISIALPPVTLNVYLKQKVSWDNIHEKQ